MFCPACGGEYREGFTTCADCQVPLVESLPAGGVPPSRGRRRSTRVEDLVAPLKVRWPPLATWVRFLLAWLVLFFVVQTLSVASDLQAMGEYDPWLQAGIALRNLFQTLVPLACIVGILTRARWARIACLVYLPVATLFQLGILIFLVRLYRDASSVMSGSPVRILPLVVSILLALIINAVFFFLVQKRGFEAPAYGSASSS